MDYFLLVAMIGTVLTGVFTYADYKNKKATREHLVKMAVLCSITFILELFVFFIG